MPEPMADGWRRRASVCEANARRHTPEGAPSAFGRDHPAVNAGGFARGEGDAPAPGPWGRWIGTPQGQHGSMQ